MEVSRRASDADGKRLRKSVAEVFDGFRREKKRVFGTLTNLARFAMHLRDEIS